MKPPKHLSPLAAAAPDMPHGWHLYENPNREERAAYRASASGGLEK